MSAGEVCPKCGSELEHGFGLAGGGYGPYTYCLAEGCDFFDKVQEPLEDPTPPPPREEPAGEVGERGQ